MNKIENIALSLLPKNSKIRQSVEVYSMLHKNGITKSKANDITVKLAHQSRELTKKNIGIWRDAQETALDVERPRRADLIDIFDDLILDNHLFGAMYNRMLKTLGRKFKIINRDTGEENVEATNALKKKWFRKYMLLSLEATYYGHSLIQFGDIVDDRFVSVSIVSRRHVIPELGVFLIDLSEDKGYSYREGAFSEWVIEVGEPDDLGLLNKAAHQVISKKMMLAFWDEFGEVFGIPIRVGKTNTRDKKELSKMEEMLSQMGASAWGLFNTGTEIEIKESKKGDAYNVFDKRVDRANSEISKLINGQTMTMDDGSSKSQAEVHAEVSKDRIEADGVNMYYNINDDLIPFLIKRGFSMFSEKDEFVWDDSRELPLKEQMEIDKWLLDHFEIEEEYFKEKYNARIVGFKKQEPTPPKPNDDADGGGDGKK